MRDHDEMLAQGFSFTLPRCAERRSSIGFPFGLALVLLGALLMLTASSASAAKHPPLGFFGSAAQPSFSQVQGIVVDQSTGDLLVLDKGAPFAEPPVAPNISRFKPDGTPDPFSALGSNAIDGKEGPDATPSEGLGIAGLRESQIAVDNSGTATDGDIYVTQSSPNAIYIFARTGEYLGSLTGSASGLFNEACGVAVDPTGAVYVGDYSRYEPVSDTFVGEIQKFEPSGNPPTDADNSATFTTVEEPCAVAAGAGPSAGALFAANYSTGVKKLNATTGAVEYEVTGGQAQTIFVDPSSGHLYSATHHPGTETDDLEELDASSPVEAKRVSNTASTAGRFTGVAVAGSTGLLYASILGDPHVEAYGPLSSLPSLGAERAVSVGTTDAMLAATLNAEGLPTTYWIEYGPTTAYGKTTSKIGIGSSESDRDISTVLEGLEPATAYHWRVVAENASGPTFGPDLSFRTYALPVSADGPCANQEFRTAASSVLPDCRAYEMVSPIDKNNGDIITRINLTGYSTALNQSSIEGTGFTFSSYRAFANPQGAPYTSQFLARRSPGTGWQSEALNPMREPGGVLTAAHDLENEYVALSADLSQGWLFRAAEPVLAPCAPLGYADLYRRSVDAGEYQALSCNQPTKEPRYFVPELQGFSADGSKAVIRVDDALTTDASSGDNFQVYESLSDGQLRLVSVLPSGEAIGLNASAGSAHSNDNDNQNRSQAIDHAMSSNGERIFWSASDGPLYLRENATSQQSLSGSCDEAGRACTIPVSESVTTEGVAFQGANATGSKVLFTVLAGPLKGNLYEFDVASEEANLIAEGVREHILGASADLSRIFFVSGSASSQAQAEGAIEGEPNIYLADAGASRFIGIFSAHDMSPQSASGRTPNAEKATNRLANVSASGLHLVFRSDSRDLSESVANYDNTDATSGKADAEVYLYDAAVDGGVGALRCLSCNPSGAQPHGREIEEGVNGASGPWGAATIPAPQTQFYNPRYLSEDGSRVFFNSIDPLVLRDTNGKQDVYQWERSGAGRCHTGSSGYVAASEGCLSLLSSGGSPSDSEFLDASRDGSNVFFTTAESLLPQDNGLIDVYDAREGGGFPAIPGQPSACEGEACQAPPAPPNDPTPTSAAFQGPGNVREKRLPRCGKSKTRRKGHCVKKKHKKQAHGRRASSNGRAGR